jgi:hypothetical protein
MNGISILTKESPESSFRISFSLSLSLSLSLSFSLSPLCSLLAVVGFELRASLLLGALPLELLHQPCFVVCIFKIGSLKLFAWAGFEPILLISASE